MNALDLHCKSNFEIGLFPSIDMSGYLFGCMFFVPKADIYGWWLFVYLQIFLFILSFILIIFLNYPVVYYIATFLIGCANSCLAFVMYTLCMEYLPGKKDLYTSILFFIE